VGQVVVAEVVAGEALEAPVVHGGGQLGAGHVDGDHRAALRRHDLTSGAGGQGHDAVPGPVADVADGQFGPAQAPHLLPAPGGPGG